MPDWVNQLLAKELHRHPLTLVFLMVSLAAGVGAGVVNLPFALASDFTEFKVTANAYHTKINNRLLKFDGRLTGLDRSICALQFTADKNALDVQIRATNAEIANIERLEFTGEALDRDRKRLIDLKSDKDQLERELRQLLLNTDCGRPA